MQFLGPALNGIYEYGCLPCIASGKNLSGSNFVGSGKLSGSLCILYMLIKKLELAGTAYFSVERKCEIFSKVHFK